MELKSSKKVPDNTTISSALKDYYVGIPYMSLWTLQKELQWWFDWANEKVMQATRRLGKDQTELKRMRQEKKDADNVHHENQMLEETNMERIVEMERALDALKKCQEAYMEKRSFEEDLSAIRQEKTSLQQQREKDNKVVDQFNVLLTQEESLKQRFLHQADSLKGETD
ncbi:hypothetical protein EJD97_016365 [Solanum chilense]|uniref:Uncharacterized protein n=1 Tax=Solanum chilense TaxID=4083 RepID=A0A6N2B9R8_SOLCI|nr:hypothetical protein EJD97_016365 [Solanum chilense]